jgi:hypothetical protein
LSFFDTYYREYLERKELCLAPQNQPAGLKSSPLRSFYTPPYHGGALTAIGKHGGIFVGAWQNNCKSKNRKNEFTRASKFSLGHVDFTFIP